MFFLHQGAFPFPLSSHTSSHHQFTSFLTLCVRDRKLSAKLSIASETKARTLSPGEGYFRPLSRRPPLLEPWRPSIQTGGGSSKRNSHVPDLPVSTPPKSPLPTAHYLEVPNGCPRNQAQAVTHPPASGHHYQPKQQLPVPDSSHPRPRHSNKKAAAAQKKRVSTPNLPLNPVHFSLHSPLPTSFFPLSLIFPLRVFSTSISTLPYELHRTFTASSAWTRLRPLRKSGCSR
ncbi:hypothetical protein B0H66DRAFT_234686 [Apodospora peruviana]|uniref:Uncharacterized protein n=1 Tax=Apodospora peruviana TaxID=516989 RepID=A0AAE0I4Q3_9PEZI|nr:hypothetical protein B0H66DRAFT_234686 [Apodospora peruviana]